MDRLENRRLEERSVQIYVSLSLLSSILIIGVLQIDAPFVGIFIAFWLVALCVIAAIATAIVVLGVNAHRVLTHKELDRWSVVVAATIPVSLSVALFVIFVEQPSRVTEPALIGSIIMMLIVAPTGLFITIFRTYVRRRLRSYT